VSCEYSHASIVSGKFVLCHDPYEAQSRPFSYKPATSEYKWRYMVGAWLSLNLYSTQLNLSHVAELFFTSIAPRQVVTVLALRNPKQVLQGLP
jgi:hypothetical protein